MNGEETKAAIAVMQAWLDGEEIRWEWIKQKPIESTPEDMPNWNWSKFRFFVKPKPKIELRVGAWYELKSARIVQCSAIGDSHITTFHDGFVCKEDITREVRVLPVEE